MPEQTPAVVILAGGSNSRFWPLRAKSLMPFLGEPLIARHIAGFTAAGCRRFVIVANDDTVEETRAAVAGLPAEVTVTVQEQPLGMGDALLSAARADPALESMPFIVSQAHDVVDPALYATFVRWAGEGVDGLITGKRMSTYFPGGYLTLDGNRVTRLVEKPGAGNEPSDMVSLVLHLHRRPAELLAAIREEYRRDVPTDDHYERAVAALLGRFRYVAVAYDGRWEALKYPWHVLGVMSMLLDTLTPSAPVEGVSGPVVLEEGVRIFPGARVVGPAWIGAGSVIGNNALVRGSMVGRHAEVGFGCEVARSYIGDGCTLHHNYIGDSVLDSRVGLGFGTVTGNWPFYAPPVRSTVKGERLHTGMEKLGAVVGADSRTGIGTLLYPGVKVGARSFVGPGVVVITDIPDGRMVLVKQELTDQANPFR